MGVVADLKLRARWTWNRAAYVAQTEGVGVLVERTAALVGLATRTLEPAELLVGPPRGRITPESARLWPLSLVVLAGSAPAHERAEQLIGLAREAGVPARPAGAAVPDTLADLQTASVLVVVGSSSWPGAAVLAEARRLRLVIVVAVEDADAHPPPGSHWVIARDEHAADALRRGLRTTPGVSVVPTGDGAAQRQAFADLVAVLEHEVTR